MNYLRELEAESIYILREILPQFEKPVLLFSGGKDSSVVAHLARKAFWPLQIPFPFLHVDTGHNFQEILDFRDQLVEKLNVKLIVGNVEDDIKAGHIQDSKGSLRSRNQLQSYTLMRVIQEHRFDGVIGGARRDEEKARAKERIFSVRDEFGAWNPRDQRPEVWNILNGKVAAGEHMRIFPLSNWTEMDVWNYIEQEDVPIPSLYFAHDRSCIRRRGGSLLSVCEAIDVSQHDVVASYTVRCRTVGDMTCTELTESRAATPQEVIAETRLSRISERGSRADDKVSECIMEDRKRMGYF